MALPPVPPSAGPPSTFGPPSVGGGGVLAVAVGTLGALVLAVPSLYVAFIVLRAYAIRSGRK